jgi:hypothetical protein
MQKHPAQQVFLQEIRIQLLAYENLLSQREDKADLYRNVRELRELIDSLIDSKRQIEIGDFKDDRVFQNITSLSEIFMEKARRVK